MPAQHPSHLLIIAAWFSCRGPPLLHFQQLCLGSRLFPLPPYPSTRKIPESGRLKSIMGFLLEPSERESFLLGVVIRKIAHASVNCGQKTTFGALPQPGAHTTASTGGSPTALWAHWRALPLVHFCGQWGSSALDVFLPFRLPGAYLHGDSRSTREKQMEAGSS